MNKEQAYKLKEEIENLKGNLKSEVIITELIENAVSLNDINVLNIGSFFRPFRHDIEKVSLYDTSDGEFKLHLDLCRNGIYDLLPEGVTHRHDTDSSLKGSNNKISESFKIRKQEETSARKFFQPFENEFFFQTVKLEQIERELLHSPVSSFYKFLTDFWGINLKNKKYENILVRLMPFMHLLAGNYKLICLCLEEILQTKVTSDLSSHTLSFPSGDSSTMGKAQLGYNFTTGSDVYAIPLVTFTYGPIKPSHLKKYLPGGDIYAFLQDFYSKVVPFEADVETKLIAEDNSLSDKDETFGVMGYSTKL